MSESQPIFLVGQPQTLITRSPEAIYVLLDRIQNL